jgi:hypothetical protein
MFSTKNITPKQIALLTALILALPESLLVLAVEKNGCGQLLLLLSSLQEVIFSYCLCLNVLSIVK